MYKPLIALCAGALLLGGCDKTAPTTPPTPKPTVDQPGPTRPGALAGTGVDPSVPSADSVLTSANATQVDAMLGRSNSPMSTAQQSMAMPMPGQNNDHSAPLAPVKPASAPP